MNAPQTLQMLARFREKWPTATFDADVWVQSMAGVELEAARIVSVRCLDRAEAPSPADFHCLLRNDVEGKQARIRELREQLAEAKARRVG